MKNVENTIERFRQPEYTGENRCIPCTIVNVLIAALGGAVLAVYSLPAAALAFAGSLVLIYFRGYLVPGTPTFTKRYLPDRVLRLFDKVPENEFAAADADGESEPVDPEELLVDATAIRPCEEGDDLCLDPDFRDEWWSRIEELRDEEEASVERLGEMLEADSESVEIMSSSGAYMAMVDEVMVAQWESEAAFLADLAAEPLLRDRLPQWDELDTENRGRVLFSLRIFLEECPACDGPVSISEELVESCCRSFDVVAANCEACETRLLEVRDVGV